jgi:hypothetical protein
VPRHGVATGRVRGTERNHLIHVDPRSTRWAQKKPSVNPSIIPGKIIAEMVAPVLLTAALIASAALAWHGRRHLATTLGQYALNVSDTTFRLTHPSAKPMPLGHINGATNGPLHASKANPRYFADAAGRTLLLAGSHTWRNLQDLGPPASPAFGYPAFLEMLVRYNHNFFRLWTWEQSFGATYTTESIRAHPEPYLRTGTGNAGDGKPKFDLTRFNPAYFERLRGRVIQARDRGIYVSVMLFNGFSVGPKKPFPGNPWPGHPFTPANNVNPALACLAGRENGYALHTLEFPEVTRFQEAYVRTVIETVNDLDNVLFEISNESNPDSCAWQYHLIRFVKSCERSMPHQHPVGMTVAYPDGNNEELFASPADWISPNSEGGYAGDPPPADGTKVILSDTDHLWGVGGDRAWIWKSFTQGLNPIFMDAYDAKGFKNATPQWEAAMRQGLGFVMTFASRMDLAAMLPHGELASQGYCLANPASPDAEYLLYLPHGGKVRVDLSATKGTLQAEWFNPRTGILWPRGPVLGGRSQSFPAPFSGDAILHLRQKPSAN